MVQPSATNQEPQPGLEAQGVQPPAAMAQFSQATAEGQQAAAIRGRRPLSGDLVHYVTTCW
ncbi:hypothetical protein KUL97_04575 [Synechococcus sp. HK05]|uniref:hypothetical protein n=1 Tax=Synechococcus sp. HK05 TaxID=2725975 RepID=UPI001C381B75|nr:hypothetical protein [Synechococcus sp. HK05]MBV2350982.1 hypothetical protein [Synechococcus sp. HK05]